MSRLKRNFRVTIRPAVSTIKAREYVDTELPLLPEGVVIWGRMSPVGL
jgi:hypothetical protein